MISLLISRYQVDPEKYKFKRCLRWWRNVLNVGTSNFITLVYIFNSYKSIKNEHKYIDVIFENIKFLIFYLV